MKPGNATLGNWEPLVDRQDTHSGLKRHEDKGRESRRGWGRGWWEMTCFLGFKGILCAERHGVKKQAKFKTSLRFQQKVWEGKNWVADGDVNMTEVSDRGWSHFNWVTCTEGKRAMKKGRKRQPTVPLHTCSHRFPHYTLQIVHLCFSKDLIWYI